MTLHIYTSYQNNRASGDGTEYTVGRFPSAWRGSSEPTAPERMSVDVLAQHCARENEQFYRTHTSDSRYAFELFRRALVERDDAAWMHIYRLYQGIVDYWVRRTSAYAHCDESSEYFVAEAFMRFWRAVPPERFASFPSLGRLLNYLQRCATCVVIDGVRAQTWHEPLAEQDDRQSVEESPETTVLRAIENQDVWSLINAQVQDESERLVIFYSFLKGLKPSAIHERHPDLFASVRDVYSIKRNVLERLSRNRELRRLLAST